MDIVIVAQFLGNIEKIENDNNRFMYLGSLLSQTNDVEIVTTDFIHSLKKHVTNVSTYRNCKITCLHEKGYPRNVCLKRFASHKELSKNIKKYLNNRKIPDVIYCAVPSLDVAYEAANYAKEKNIPFIIDIQDLWPEAFQMVFNIPIVSNLIFAPLKRKANYVYKSADHIVAVSKTYVERGKLVNKTADTTVTFLGTEMSMFDAYAQSKTNIKFENDKIYLGYVGTLGHSYDLPLAFEAMRLLPTDILDKIQFIVMGDGPKKQEFEKISSDLPVIFTGRIPYGDMVSTLCKCDIAVNPIVKGAAGSIINKHGDYTMAGLPVISTQENQEYRCLIDDYKMGFNCAPGDAKVFAKKLVALVDDKELREKLGANARLCGEECFDRSKSYLEIIECIKNFSKDKNN